jgi:two-component system NtrC family response regulator
MSGMLGQCPQMLDVFATIKKVATVDVPVLILGESGTGKELVGKAIHNYSLRKEAPFIPINCGAIPENLLESELFGHEKGAFTGAQAQIQGKVEYAHKGTLFLDEIGEMPTLLQVKILRFLQEKLIQRVGGREDIIVDARIIAATNIDIEKAIAEDKFREDLYYRIGVITITLPPLRERDDDLDLLASFFLKRFSKEFNRKIRGFSKEALVAMYDYTWPGNVRELENKVKRAVVMSDGLMVEPWDLGLAKRPTDSVDLTDPSNKLAVDNSGKMIGGVNISGMTIKDARSLVEMELLVTAIKQHDGNILATAKALGVSRPTLYDLMKKHGMN